LREKWKKEAIRTHKREPHLKTAAFAENSSGVNRRARPSNRIQNQGAEFIGQQIQKAQRARENVPFDACW
jgi:hypothetical protein